MSSTFTIRDIVNEDATASVSDYGAHVLSWAPAGEQAVVWRPKAIHLKEGTAIRGGVPIIFPWFNSGFEGGHVASKKPKHGFARNSFWHYDKEGSSDALLRYTLDSSEINADILSQFVSGPNPQFHAVYTIEVGCELTSHCLTKRHCIRICRSATPNSRRCAGWRAPIISIPYWTAIPVAAKVMNL